MVERYYIEALDRSLQDIMHGNQPFRGKTILMGGDFHQLLPVIPRGCRATIVQSCISSSYLWDPCIAFRLTKNMRLSSAKHANIDKLAQFSQWLLDVWDGQLGLLHDGAAVIEVLEELLIRDFKCPLHAIVAATYPQLFDDFKLSSIFQ